MADFNMISCDKLISTVEDRLSSYQANGLLDTGKFYHEIFSFVDQLKLAVYELKDAVVPVCDGKGELPCDFAILDSAWLCNKNHQELEGNFNWRNFQDKVVIYSEKECATVEQACGNPNIDGVVVNGCFGDRVLDRVIVKEYVMGNPYAEWNRQYNFLHPTLLALGDKVTKGICSKGCQNLFCTSKDAISIKKQGDTYYLYSAMKNPLIFIKYYAAPVDPETRLPLIPDDSIFYDALLSHLTAFFFETIWTNGDEVEVEKKVQYWKAKAQVDRDKALYLAKLPSFNKMIETTRRNRKRFASYEIMNIIHPL